MNKQKVAYQNLKDEDMKPEALQRQSMKGLFTFYRQQQQVQQLQKKQKNQHKFKHKHLKLIRIKTQQKDDQKEKIREIKSHKKKRSKTKSNNQSKSLERKIKKKKKRSQKINKALGTSNNGIQNDLNVNDQIELNQKDQDPYERFLKRIKQYKRQRSHKTSLSAINQLTSQNVSNTQDVNQKFYKLVYPKDSVIDQQTRVNNFRDKLQKKIQQHLNQRLIKTKGQDLMEKKKIIIDDFLQKRSESRLKKSSLVARKRLFTQLPFEQSNIEANNVKSNFYSHLKRNVTQNFYSQDINQPISPPTSTRVNNTNEVQQMHEIKNLKSQRKNLSQSLKLPHIKNVRLSKELNKITEVASRQLSPVYRFDSNKSKKCFRKQVKANSEGKIKIKKKLKQLKQVKDLAKKGSNQLQEQDQGKCHVALIDLGKSQHNEQQENLWKQKKKILFKKLGLKL